MKRMCGQERPRENERQKQREEFSQAAEEKYDK
jgi:hypothetical protein